EISHEKSELPVVGSAGAPFVADPLDLALRLFVVERLHDHAGIARRIDPSTDVSLLPTLNGPGRPIEPGFHTDLDGVMVKQLSQEVSFPSVDLHEARALVSPDEITQQRLKIGLRADRIGQYEVPASKSLV